MTIEVRRRRGVCIVGLTGRLTLGGGEAALRRRFDELLAAGERRFVFDLAGLRTMDSAGVGETVSCHKRALEHGAVLKIAVPPGVVRRVFSVTCLDRAFEIFEDERQAVASFR